MFFLFSDRAKRSRQAASALGIENVELMYDGGLEMADSDLIRQFYTGRPPGNGSYPVVVGVVEDDGHFTTFKAIYIPQEDILIADWGKRPRNRNDLWIPLIEFPRAVRKAVEISKRKECELSFQ